MPQYAEDVDTTNRVRPDTLYRYPENRPVASGCFYKVVLDDFHVLYLEWSGNEFDRLYEDRVAFFYSPKRLRKKAKESI